MSTFCTNRCLSDPLTLSDFIFVSVRTGKMPAIVVSGLEPSRDGILRFALVVFTLNTELEIHLASWDSVNQSTPNPPLITSFLQAAHF